MGYKSVNPCNGELLKTFDNIKDEEMFNKLEEANKAYNRMREQGKEGLSKRLEKMKNLKTLLQDRKQKIGETITLEMGKPIA